LYVCVYVTYKATRVVVSNSLCVSKALKHRVDAQDAIFKATVASTDISEIL